MLEYPLYKGVYTVYNGGIPPVRGSRIEIIAGKAAVSQQASFFYTKRKMAETGDLMGVTIVVGGQFGSEGKGKVARYFANKFKVTAAVRVGGTNSGHTVIGADGQPVVFRSLPTAALDGEATCVLPAGSYINVDLLFREIKMAGLPPDKLKIHPNAVIITQELIESEQAGGLIEQIGSTGSGTGAAVSVRVNRDRRIVLAENVPELKPFLLDTGEFLRGEVMKGAEVLIEGTQGFGLSNLHSPYFPKATSRDTTAAGFLSEAGLSPFDVTRIIQVIRSYPIRVAGDSGDLPNELVWETVTERAQSAVPLREYTSVTQKIRRVGAFDAAIVLKSIQANRPSHIVLNHLDYIPGRAGLVSAERAAFMNTVQRQIHAKIDYIGMDRETIYEV